MNLENQVVGIPTLAARLPEQGGAAPGIGFAIPSDTVRKIAKQLIKTGHVTNSDRASLGIIAQTSANQQGDRSASRSWRWSAAAPRRRRAWRTGDVIVGLNGQHDQQPAAAGRHAGQA